jgi:hypothetical protein
VQIYASTTKFGGETVECLRIRKEPPEDARIPCEECGQFIAPAFSMSATQLAAYTKKKYGKNLCPECAKQATAIERAEVRRGVKHDAAE